MAKTLPALREDATDLFMEAMRVVSGHLDAAAAVAGLTPMQAMLLYYLDDDRPVPMTEIARKLHCDTSNATGLVDRLEHNNLIVRVTPATDRRVRAVQLTDQGHRSRAELRHRIRAENPAFEHLSKDQLVRFAELLRLISGGPSSRGE